MSEFVVVSVIGKQVVLVSDGTINDEAHATLVVNYDTTKVDDKVGDVWKVTIH